jgi:hypothetical protein
MKVLSVFCLALLVLLTTCKKDDDPKFTSAEGDWTYTIPEGHLTLNFTLTRPSSGTTFNITNYSMSVDGTAYETVLQTEDVQVAGSIFNGIPIFNINDTKEPYPYPIKLRDGKMNDDFTKIEVSSATYTWPNGTDNTVSNITISRK